jgi:hypothetical protein
LGITGDEGDMRREISDMERKNITQVPGLKLQVLSSLRAFVP